MNNQFIVNINIIKKVFNLIMESKYIQNKISLKEFLDPLKKSDFCDASKASVEIMLERFSNGKKIDFPFSQ